MFFEGISSQAILFFSLYGITGVVPLIAAVYLLFRRGNAFMPHVSPPMRLRRWAASFFALSALGHVWWYIFYTYFGDINSAGFVVLVMLDCMTLITTIAGTLLSMLQDRKRPEWIAFAGMIPFVALSVLQILYPDGPFMKIAAIYILSFYVLFSGYMVYAVRQYGRWLNDNYADLEDKKVWLTQVLSLICMLSFFLYAFTETDIVFIYLMHVAELILFGLLLWRVETLPQLDSIPAQETDSMSQPDTVTEPETVNQVEQAPAVPANIDLSHIEKLLKKKCVATRLYLQHDLSLQQLAQALGTNRYYLSQYFRAQGINYNAYINGLRINHFINRYHEVSGSGQPFTVQQLASESGYHSYSTFSLAFKQRMGQSVTAWMSK